MKIDLAALNLEIEAGNIKKQVHPTLPLSIFKYSRQAVYTRHWNELTLTMRGMVLDNEGNIVINCMPKAFNHSELDGQQVYENGRKNSTATEITEKLDGSLIQVALYNGQLVISSSGSFTSPQAIKAAEFFKRDEYRDLIEDGKTYIFEIIYPQNRIVINYGEEESLTLLAIRDTDSGFEYQIHNPTGIYPIPRVKTTFADLDYLEKELEKEEFINKEGYIVKFEDGSRVKLKYAEYFRLHKIVSNCSEKFIWESLRDGVNLDETLGNIPDELFDFIKATRAKLLAEYKAVEDSCIAAFEDTKQFETRKEKAAHLMRNFKAESAIVFCMLDERDYSKRIWDMIEPKVIVKEITEE